MLHVLDPVGMISRTFEDSLVKCYCSDVMVDLFHMLIYGQYDDSSSGEVEGLYVFSALFLMQ